jgi:hypothetical protein
VASVQALNRGCFNTDARILCDFNTHAVSPPGHCTRFVCWTLSCPVVVFVPINIPPTLWWLKLIILKECTVVNDFKCAICGKIMQVTWKKRRVIRRQSRLCVRSWPFVSGARKDKWVAQMVISKRRISRFCGTRDPCIVQVWCVDRQVVEKFALRPCTGCSAVGRLSYYRKENKMLLMIE